MNCWVGWRFCHTEGGLKCWSLVLGAQGTSNFRDSSLRWKENSLLDCLCYILRIEEQVWSWKGVFWSADALIQVTPCHCKGLGLSPPRGQAFGKALPPLGSSARRRVPSLPCTPHGYTLENSDCGEAFAPWCMWTLPHVHSTAGLCDQGRAVTKQASDHLVQFLRGTVSSSFSFLWKQLHISWFSRQLMYRSLKESWGKIDKYKPLRNIKSDQLKQIKLFFFWKKHLLGGEIQKIVQHILKIQVLITSSL